MKPRFAISFTDDGLALLHRESRGWVSIGQVGFDNPEMDQAIDWLRSTALGLSPEGVHPLLVIPNSQILYTRVPVTGMDEAARRAEIAVALEGRTPYAVSDLVFDYVMSGDVAQVAVVARETLEEAEGFTLARRMTPLGFTSVPPDGAFDAAPFFGPAVAAVEVLAPGEVVAREAAPVRAVVAEAETPAPEATPEAVEPDLPPAAPDMPDAAPEEPVAPEEVATAEDAPAQAQDDSALEVVEEVAVIADDQLLADVVEAAPGWTEVEEQPVPAAAPEPAPVPDFAEVYAAELARAEPEPAPEPQAAPIPDPIPEPEPAPASSRASVLAEPDAFPDEAPIALDVPPEPEPRPVVGGDGLSVTDPAIAPAPAAKEAGTPVPSAIAASLGFASRRAVEASVVPAVKAPEAPKPAPRAVGGVTRGKGEAAPATKDRAPPAPPAAPRAPDRPAERAALAKAPKDDPKRAKVTMPSIPVRRSAIVTSKPAAAAAPANPAVFNPKGRPPVRGKPRHLGLILTGMLLIFLAVAAALSSFYITGYWSDDSDPATETASATDSAAPAAEAADVPDIADEMAADGQEPDGAPEDETAAAPEAAAPAAAAVAPAATAEATAPAAEVQTAEQAAPAEVAPPTAQAIDPAVASTEAATVADPAAVAEEIILSAADRAPAATDAGALPVPRAQGDPPPATLAAPPPFGTVYQFDANGLIVPTPEGILSPEGVLLVAGPPPIKPPPRPEGLAPAATPASDAPATPEEAAATPFPADPALADARPRARPEGLAPEDVAPTEALIPAVAPGANLASLASSGQPLVSLRPAARPAIETAGTLQGQEDALAGASLATSATTDPNRSVLAIAVSRRPTARPADMARAVEAAVAAAARMPDPTPVAPPPAAAPAPEPEVPLSALAEADAEPEHDGPMPSLPTRANVAKQATVANVLSMSKLSLIGIYGTPSARHALVRQPNGRYVKVAIGDRLDGGRVAAITESELRYEKGGRMVVLAMPRG
jgi:hypothetical protein